MATGKITQIIGPVIDVEFPREAIPQVYEALRWLALPLARQAALAVASVPFAALCVVTPPPELPVSVAAPPLVTCATGLTVPETETDPDV